MQFDFTKKRRKDNLVLIFYIWFDKNKLKLINRNKISWSEGISKFQGQKYYSSKSISKDGLECTFWGKFNDIIVSFQVYL